MDMCVERIFKRSGFCVRNSEFQKYFQPASLLMPAFHFLKRSFEGFFDKGEP